MPSVGGPATQSGAVSSFTTEPDRLEPGVEAAIAKLWLSAHGFITPDAWLLQPETQKQIWKDVHNSNGSRLPVILIERLRLASSFSPSSSGTTCSFKPGDVVRATTTIADSVFGAVEVFTRMRAFLFHRCLCEYSQT